MQSFFDKGRLRPLLEAIPVQVVTNEKAGLLGAARCASSNAASGKGSTRAEARAKCCESFR